MSRYVGYLKGVMHPMRYLHFTVENKRYYELVTQGSTNTSREISIKREARVFDKMLVKLEDVGVKGELLNDAIVALEDAEYDLLIECLEQVKWTTQGVREAYKMMEWLKEAPTKPTLELDVKDVSTA